VSFAWHRRRLIYLGLGYNVGHVEVLGDRCISTHCQGTIRLGGQDIPISRKPLFSLPNLGRGHAEGVIFEIHGVEHRIKVEKTHDLIVTHLEPDAVVVETSEGDYRFKYRRPQFPLHLGSIVECANTVIFKHRTDKVFAETKESYDRIENSLTYMPFLKALRRGMELNENKERYQVKPYPKLIRDEKLYSSILTAGSLVSLQRKFGQYHPRDIVRTVGAIGAIIESTNYGVPKKLPYKDYLNYYSNVGLEFVDVIEGVDCDLEFDFGFSCGLDEVVRRDNTIIECVDNPIEEEVRRDAYGLTMLESSIRIVEEMPQLARTQHHKICDVQIMRVSNLHCSACVYNNAVKYLNAYVASYGHWSNDDRTDLYEFVRKNRIYRLAPWRRTTAYGSRAKKKGLRSKGLRDLKSQDALLEPVGDDIVTGQKFGVMLDQYVKSVTRLDLGSVNTGGLVDVSGSVIVNSPTFGDG